MKGSSYSLRVMKKARHTSHLTDQHHLGASSLATATLHTIQSNSGTPVQTPDEVCVFFIFLYIDIFQITIIFSISN